MESDVKKMTPEQKEWWKKVWLHMINHYNKYIDSPWYNKTEKEYMKQAITKHEEQLKSLD